MLEEINVLREKLEKQVLENVPYNDILSTSKELDKLLIEYYKSSEVFKKVV